MVIEGNRKQKYRDPILKNGVVTDITMEDYNRFYNITDFIAFNGNYQVSDGIGNVSIRTRRRPIASPTIFFNDVLLSNFSILSNFSTANVERIIIDRNGFGYGVNAGFGGIIKIYTRTTSLFEEQEGSKLYLASEAPLAFATSKKFYAPRYASFQNDIFQEYGVISWIPTVKLDTTKAANFKVFDTKTDRITLFIEGISENGDLISEQKTIQVR